MARPECSVLLCTWNRAGWLRLVLESLCRQSADRDRFEVVVVDDGSTDDTARVAESFAARLDLRYAAQRHSGLASARNHALFLARGRIVLLQDDDDIAGPHLVAEHLRAHQAHPEDPVAVLGYTDLFCDIASDPLMRYVTEVEGFLFAYGGLIEGQVLDFSYFWGGRSSCKRRFLLEHGVFDPVFAFGCEDIELAWRLSTFGLRVVYHPLAVSTMMRAFSFDEFCERRVRQGRSNWIVSRLHPEPEVQRWAQIGVALREWEALAPRYEVLLRAGRKLDDAVRAKRALGLPATPERAIHDESLLHEAYRAAFRASLYKGIAEKAAEPG